MLVILNVDPWLHPKGLEIWNIVCLWNNIYLYITIYIWFLSNVPGTDKHYPKKNILKQIKIKWQPDFNIINWRVRGGVKAILPMSIKRCFILPLNRPTGPLGRFGLVLTKSVCLSVCRYVCIYVPSQCNLFWGFLLALRSHYQFESSHWSTLLAIGFV